MEPLTIERTPLGHTDLNPIGYPLRQIPQHARLLQGHWPQVSSTIIEFVTTAQGLSALQKTNTSFTIGHIFHFQIPLQYPYGYTAGSTTLAIALEDVGVIALPSQADPFWYAQSFQPLSTSGTTTIPAIFANEGLANALASMINQGSLLAQPLTLNWYFPLNLAHFDLTHLSEVAAQMTSLLNDLNQGGNTYALPPYVRQSSAQGPTSIFQYFADRATLVQVPIDLLLFLGGTVLLLFVTIIVSLLIEQQDTQIAFLRSRGATRGQLIGSLILQGAVLALPTLLLSPFLAWILAIHLATWSLPTHDFAATNVLTAQALTSMLRVAWIALTIVGAALVVMGLMLFQKLRSTVLSQRRDASRSNHPPLWQRLHLDLAGMAVATVGAGYALYLANGNTLDPRSRSLILPPVLLAAFLGLLLMFLLLFFRCFPSILRIIARFALQRRGATAALALAQTARSPWKAMRMALLLTFTLAFAIFTLTFQQSQQQRIVDGTAFQIGSDFSGTLSGPANASTWQQTEQDYAQIRGVQSATIGHVGILVTSTNLPIDLQAVDPTTCFQTMSWPGNSPHDVPALLARLVIRRQSSIAANVVPALVDASAAQAMSLMVGSQFSLRDDVGTVTFVTIGIVPAIPGIVDAPQSAGTSDATVAGGVLADYDTFASVQTNLFNNDDTAESIWLKTTDNPALLDRIRTELNTGQAQLNLLSDRRAVTADLSYDPLETAIGNGLLAAAALALLLGLLGSLLGSWADARQRVTSFAVMHALGSTRRQIAGIILWEQLLVYSTALLLGLASGLLFAHIVTPGILYTPVISSGIEQTQLNLGGLNLTGTGSLYLVQNMPPAQVIIPPMPLITTVAGLALICALCLTLITHFAQRLTPALALRLSKD
jgi:hypothetical protein